MNDNLPPSARKRVCIDFDGTLFPWGEQHNDEPAFPMAAEVVTRIQEAGYEIVIFTSRMSPTWWLDEGWNLKEAMQRELKYVQDRLEKHGIPYDRITCEKVPGKFYLDDKAIMFDGDWTRASASTEAAGLGISQMDLVWFAGLFEGEGNIDLGHGRGNSVTVQISMTDRDIIDRCQSVFKGIGGRWVNPRDGYKTLYGWRVQNREDCELVINLILPWLGERRKARALEALVALKNNKGKSADRTHCPSGHEYSEDNLVITSENKRQCKACARLAGNRWYNRNRGKINEKRRARYADKVIST